MANLFGKVKLETFGKVKEELDRLRDQLEDADAGARDGIERKLVELLVADGYQPDPAAYFAWWLLTVPRDVTYETPEEVEARLAREKKAGVPPVYGAFVRTGREHDVAEKKLEEMK